MSEGYYDYLKITDLKDMLNKTDELYKDNIAYKIKIEKNKYITYTHKEVRNMVNALGTSLINMGLKNKRIAVIGENRYEWEIAYLAIVCGVGIVVPLDKSLPENELKYLIKKSEVDAIFCSEKYIESLERIKYSGTGKLKHIISMDLNKHEEGIYSQKELIENGKNLLQNGNKEYIDANINPKETSIMLFTSGTTSKPKIVTLSHENICTNLMDLASILDVNSNDILLSVLPIHHVFECTVGFLFALYKGAQTVFTDGLRHIVDNLKEYKVTVMACVPAIYERIFKMIRMELEKQDKLNEILKKELEYKELTMEEKKEKFNEIHEIIGGNLKLFISGAAPLDKYIEEKYRLLGINIVQGYGLTETSPVIAIGNNKNYKLGSIGKAVPSVEVKIIDKNKEGIGELCVKGKSVMLGYFENEEANKNAFNDGWFCTGDLARIDEEGYIFICGRKKNVIVLKNGKNIYPEEMENLINRIEGVKESFVFGKQKSEDKDDIKVFVKIVFDRKIISDVYNVQSDNDIYNSLLKEIKEINKILPKYKSIKGIILSEDPLIKTTTNKIKRQDNLDIINKNTDNNYNNDNNDTDINTNIDTKFLGKNNFYYKTIDSTQSEIWRLYEKNAPNGTLVLADKQTDGKGTHNKKWYTDESNNIAFSFLIRPNCNIEKLDGLTSRLAEIITNVFKQEYNIILDIKKPNDIMYNNKKIGGILTETKVASEQVKALAVGIGINTSQTNFNKNIEDIATSIKKEFNIDVNVENIINNFCIEFEKEIIERIEN